MPTQTCLVLLSHETTVPGDPAPIPTFLVPVRAPASPSIADRIATAALPANQDVLDQTLLADPSRHKTILYANRASFLTPHVDDEIHPIEILEQKKEFLATITADAQHLGTPDVVLQSSGDLDLRP